MNERKNEEELKSQDDNSQDTRGEVPFEDMIAYVDEYGVIRSTPPKENKKGGSSRKSDGQGNSGIVEHYNTSKGYGFIKDDNSSKSYFFHITNAPNNINEGDLVTFELEEGRKGLNAVRVEFLIKDF